MAFEDEHEDLGEGFEMPETGPIFNLENGDTPAVLEEALLEATSEIGDRVRAKMKKDKYK